MQIDARCDAQMLEGLCVNYQRAVDADIQIAREGAIVKEPVYVHGKRKVGVYRCESIRR